MSRQPIRLIVSTSALHAAASCWCGGRSDLARSYGLPTLRQLKWSVDTAQDLARVRAIVRRTAGQASPLMEMNGVSLDTRQMRVSVSGVPVTLITDNMAASVMAQGKINGVIVGTDRVAANGDVCNKIGTLGVAILAKEFGIPFYVAAPMSSIDMSLASGDLIPIEERKAEEITEGFGKRTAPHGVQVYNPAFDVTPHKYVTALITEKGIVCAPFGEELKRLFV
ncbi:MAG: hypothetical protein HC853_05880 [Anaerolineae bacterium]|nr:hypothetical protein [Anaerolineae bacterium]